MSWNDRRTLLRLAVGGLAAGVAGLVGALARFVVPDVLYESERRFPVGRPADFAAGSVTLVAEHRVYVFRAADGFFAVSAVCTHLGCNVTHREKGFACPCHGSTFDGEGRVLRGPAPKPLPRYAMTLSRRGELVVDTTKVVGLDFRLRA